MNKQQKEIYNNKPNDANFRKKWNRSEYEKQLEDRDSEGVPKKKRHGEPVVERDFLKARNDKPDLESQLGRVQVISSTSGNAGFRCVVCDCVLKDSQTYYDHINGKRHQRMQNMSMTIEHATLEQVQERLKELAKQKKDLESGPSDVKERLLAMQNIEKKPRKLPVDSVKPLSAREEEMQSIMGFQDFSSTKK